MPLWICQAPFFFFQLLCDLELALAIRLAAGREIGAAQLIVDIGSIRLELYRSLQMFHRSFDITLLQQNLAQFIMRIGIIGLAGNHFLHQLNAAIRFLIRQEDIAKVIF